MKIKIKQMIIFTITVLWIGASIGWRLGSSHKELEINQAFQVLERDNRQDHPIKKCLKEHWENTKHD